MEQKIISRFDHLVAHLCLRCTHRDLLHMHTITIWLQLLLIPKQKSMFEFKYVYNGKNKLEDMLVWMHNA